MGATHFICSINTKYALIVWPHPYLFVRTVENERQSRAIERELPRHRPSTVERTLRERRRHRNNNKTAANRVHSSILCSCCCVTMQKAAISEAR